MDAAWRVTIGVCCRCETVLGVSAVRLITTIEGHTIPPKAFAVAVERNAHWFIPYGGKLRNGSGRGQVADARHAGRRQPGRRDDV